MKSIQRKQGGFSLVEILLVLGIIALLAIAAFIIFPQVQAANRANAEQSNITTMAAGIKNLYGGTRNYSGLQNTVIMKARIAPSNMYGNKDPGSAVAADLQSSWSQPVTVAPATNVSQFTITYDAVPSEVCTRLVPGLLANFSSVRVGTSTTVTAGNPSEIVEACAAAPTANVTFTSN